MDREEAAGLLKAQHEYFASGATLDIKARRAALLSLRRAVRAREADIAKALRRDLGKPHEEGYMCETGLVLEELSWMIKNLGWLAAPRYAATPLAQFRAKSYVLPSPKGAVLVISPLNYPILLTLGPMIDAIAAGNTVVLKPSAYSPACSALLEELIPEALPPELAAVVTGGREENRCLLSLPFDHIFFTGSKAVGREVLAAAAPKLIPVTLELGGKSPCIVDRTANIPLAARRIVFGKLLNCGQTCVAPDYVLCSREVHDRLVEAIKKEIVGQAGASPLDDQSWGRIVNRKHFDRLCSLIDPEKVVIGGASDPGSLRIEPTVMTGVTLDDAVMGQEIFGPILPVMVYDDIGQALDIVNGGDRPLALYVFTEDKRLARRVLRACRFGGGCVNDTVIHLATTNMPFGGAGESGMGGYHGRAGFDQFSYLKSIVDKDTRIDLPMRYRPYTALKDRLVRMFLK